MVKASTKTAFRLIKKHVARFITIMAIVLVSVGFMSGVGEVQNKIRNSSAQYYYDQNVSDLYVKSKSQTGFSQEQLSFLAQTYGEENLLNSLCYEEPEGEKGAIRIYCFDIANADINKLQLLSGRLPQNPNEVLVERQTNSLKQYNVGDIVKITNVEHKVCGVVLNPMHLINEAEQSFISHTRHLTSIVYINSPLLPGVNDVYVRLADEQRAQFENSFSKGYKSVVNEQVNLINQSMGKDNVSVLTLYENYGYYSMVEYADKVGTIGIVFVVFFLLVTLLVVYSTMSRLLAEERAQIACQTTLGYGKFKILLKYILFVFMATIIGSILAYPVGFGLTHILYSAFNLKYAMPSSSLSIVFTYFLIVVGIILLSVLTLVLITGLKMLKENPAKLLTPKSPKSGKKVILEKTFIWNRLSFKYKSTVRNVLLYKSRFFMTVISIMGASILVFCGMGVMDCSLNIAGGEMLKSIAIVLVVFSAALCALIIYNLTNINISERNREIATLMVLGYRNKEILGYIFREIYIMSAIGALLGLPVGLAFIRFVFELISFGTIADIQWTTYVFTPIISMAFAVLSTFMLTKKIISIDMNASLKSVE